MSEKRLTKMPPRAVKGQPIRASDINNLSEGLRRVSGGINPPRQVVGRSRRSAVGSVFKARVATTKNIDLVGPQTIDSVAAVAGDLVLVKNQTTTSLNGLYKVGAAAWQLAANQPDTGDIISVSEGAFQAGLLFVVVPEE